MSRAPHVAASLKQNSAAIAGPKSKQRPNNASTARIQGSSRRGSCKPVSAFVVPYACLVLRHPNEGGHPVKLSGSALGPQKTPRRTLDDMRKLSEEIKLKRQGK